MRVMFLTKWDGEELECACFVENKLCKNKECEELEFKLFTYDGIEECMQHRKYKKKHGVIKQI